MTTRELKLADGPHAPALSDRQRRARAIAGLALLASGAFALRWPRLLSVPTAVAAGWLGASHLVAAALRYHGCPELGAIPTLVLGRRVETRCGPWEMLDDRLSLAGSRATEGGHRASCRPL
jgi:hypothetical protein